MSDHDRVRIVWQAGVAVSKDKARDTTVVSKAGTVDTTVASKAGTIDTLPRDDVAELFELDLRGAAAELHEHLLHLVGLGHVDAHVAKHGF